MSQDPTRASVGFQQPVSTEGCDVKRGGWGNPYRREQSAVRRSDGWSTRPTEVLGETIRSNLKIDPPASRVYLALTERLIRIPCW